MVQHDSDLTIIDVKAYPTSFPVKPADSISRGIGVEVDEDFLVGHPVIEGPSYV